MERVLYMRTLALASCRATLAVLTNKDACISVECLAELQPCVRNANFSKD